MLLAKTGDTLVTRFIAKIAACVSSRLFEERELRILLMVCHTTGFLVTKKGGGMYIFQHFVTNLWWTERWKDPRKGMSAASPLNAKARAVGSFDPSTSSNLAMTIL